MGMKEDNATFRTGMKEALKESSKERRESIDKLRTEMKEFRMESKQSIDDLRTEMKESRMEWKQSFDRLETQMIMNNRAITR